MKKFLLALLLLTLLTIPAIAADTPPLGWGPSAVLSMGAFYANGDYKLEAMGAGYGTSYKWQKGTNISEVGIYLGPQASQIGNVATATVNASCHYMLYNNFSVGVGMELWRSAVGFEAPDRNKVFMLLGYNLTPAK